MAEWIWINSAPQKEEYGCFRAVFNNGDTLKICAETDYVARVNGRVAGFGCFPGWRDEKYYDTIDISAYTRDGENTLEITVRYEGADSSTHINDGAGLWFEIPGGICSGPDTMCCEDTRYVSHSPRTITGQLGLASDMANCALPEFRKAVLTGRDVRLSPRPVKLMTVCPAQNAVLIDPGKRLYDLGRETAGYLFISVNTPVAQTIEVAWGEHIKDSCVRQRIGSRNYSMRFTTVPGENSFTQYFVRIAGRYLEVHAPDACEVISIGVIPTLYPVTEKSHSLTGLDARIIDTCVRTLRLCMHFHYEDCPWREQALYVLDSRNQMLCGYKVFNETEYARANLAFIAKGVRDDGLLELTYPAVNTPAIPFFSVMYPVEVLEYVENTGDKTIIPEVFHRIVTIFEALNRYMSENGLIRNLPMPYWNFYEWSDGSEGQLNRKEEGPLRYDLILNCAYCYASEAVKKLAEYGGIKAPKLYDTEIKSAIDRVFNHNGVYCLSTVDERRSRLGNALALLIGLGDSRTFDALINDTKLIPETLSMAGYVYDAILAASPNGREIVLNDIREKYGMMLDDGATSFWETLKGDADFNNAGSLCHGWSAMPIMYLL